MVNTDVFGSSQTQGSIMFAHVFKHLAIAAFGIGAASAAPAVAQTAPQSRLLTVQFSGVVTNDVRDTISIRQPNGTFTPYAGPVPAFDYKKGDAVTISFSTNVPTSAYYAANPAVPRAADGIYRFFVQGPNAGTNGFGVTRNFDVSGPLAPATDFGIGGITLVYDSNTESYSLEFPRGSWGAGNLVGPSYVYDGATGDLLPTSRNCFFLDCSGGATLTGNATQVQLNTPVGSSTEPSNVGFFSLLFGGSWNLPVNNGGATQVPEPGMMVLFGGGVALLLRRRSRVVRG
jgi:hypothetical protein